MDGKKYTQNEIYIALSRLNMEMEELIILKEDIDSKIKRKKENIKFYQGLNKGQYKAF